MCYTNTQTCADDLRAEKNTCAGDFYHEQLTYSLTEKTQGQVWCWILEISFLSGPQVILAVAFGVKLK